MSERESTPNPAGRFPSGNQILLIGIVGEIFLGIVGWLWAWGTSTSVLLDWSLPSALLGCLAAAPLLIISILVLERGGVGARIPGYMDFRQEFVVPLCRELNHLQTILLSILSGLFEEYLFRGVMFLWVENSLGFFPALLISSLSFSYLHFIGQVRRFFGLFWIYSLAGIYLAIIAAATESLCSVMITHALYNYCTIQYLRTRSMKEIPT